MKLVQSSFVIVLLLLSYCNGISTITYYGCIMATVIFKSPCSMNHKTLRGQVGGTEITYDRNN